jgi:hypothetical protein
MIDIVKVLEEQCADDEVQIVEIELGEYAEMVWRDSLLTMILKGLFDNATLSYRGDDLSFSASNIDQILRYGFPEKYKCKLAELKAEKAKQEAEAEKEEMISLINLSGDEEETKDE